VRIPCKTEARTKAIGFAPYLNDNVDRRMVQIKCWGSEESSLAASK
jgi:hypothetical protein